MSVPLVRQPTSWCLLCSLLTSQLLFCSGAADTSILECNLLLQDTLNFDVAEDIPEQRTALVEFFNSTGGQDWSVGIAGTQTRTEIAEFQGYILQIGQLAAQASFDPASLPADVQSVYYAVQQLSTNCRLQRSLQLINLLGKVAWNTANVSYCNWLGVACCQSTGDFYTQYCSLGSQSVAQIFVTGANLRGTIPASLGTALPDLQLVDLRNNPGLYGRFPDVLPIVAAKIQSVELRNTSLLQCNASHVTGLENAANGSTVTLQESYAASLTNDDRTSCLPNFLRFCPSTSTFSSGQQCPTIAFDRPYGVYPFLASQITAYAGLISLFGSDVSLYTGGDYVTNSSCPTDSTAGGILGPSVGQLTATANMDPSFYSWVGCNCSSASRERVYSITTGGDGQNILAQP
ncbi:hypothetical protein ABBQ38_004919 [Trebouxia sp. C0009 RCD-2024]